MPSPVIADVKSPWSSKVNWLAGLTAAVATASELLPIIPPAYQHYATTFIVVAGGIATIVTKTFYTTSVSSSSVPSAAPTSAVIHDDSEGQRPSDALNITSLAMAKVAEKGS